MVENRNWLYIQYKTIISIVFGVGGEENIYTPIYDYRLENK